MARTFLLKREVVYQEPFVAKRLPSLCHRDDEMSNTWI